MKDEEARERILRLEERLTKFIEQEDEKKPDIYVRYCPKCKHNTPHQEGNSATFYSYWHIDERVVCYDHLCLVCGSKIKCVTKTTCHIVRRKKQ